MLLAAAALVLLLPGAVWELWLPRTGTVLRDFIEGIADAIGLSVALTAIAGMIFFFTGGQFSGLLVFILFSVSFVAVAATNETLPMDKILAILEASREPISLETPVGDDDSTLGDFLEIMILSRHMIRCRPGSLLVG